MRKARNLDYINWYNSQNYDRITILAPKGTRENIKAEAKSRGQSANEFLLKLIPRHLIAERVFIGKDG